MDLAARQHFYLAANFTFGMDITSVLGYYNDFIVGQAGGVATTYAGLPAVRICPANATHQVVVFPHGFQGDAIKARFADAVRALDTSVTMIALSHVSSGFLFFFSGNVFAPWEINAVLALRPEVVAGGAFMQVGTGSFGTPMESYVPAHRLPGVPLTGFVTLFAGSISNAFS